ncbi:MAG: acetyl-CoA C-acyltransferase family protein [Bacillales bacterium]|nr:acetyl-CoA C-acyltransferase family protein [Bacillales bacterium]
MKKTVIVSGARTPFGKFGGGLSSFTASQLGGMAIKEAINRANIEADIVDEVIIGNVLQGGQGQLPSRQAMRYAELPWKVKTKTLNKVCASGMLSVITAHQQIQLGEDEVIIAGGMESMSNAPYYMSKARFGARMGHATLNDALISDGLTCSFTGVHMGEYGDLTASDLDISREEQDKWALRSHDLALKSQEEGFFSSETFPVPVKQKKGDPLLIVSDESPRADTNLSKLSKLKAAFSKDGTITAGNAPGINDGAVALVLMSEEKALNLGQKPLATLIAHSAVSVEAKDFPKTPGIVINELLKKTGKTVDDIDIFEINEAFSAVALASAKIAGIPHEKINVNGGAVALGHPIGASGARIILTMIYELKRRGGGIGIAAICSGGGQGDAVMIEV